MEDEAIGRGKDYAIFIEEIINSKIVFEKACDFGWVDIVERLHSKINDKTFLTRCLFLALTSKKGSKIVDLLIKDSRIDHSIMHKYYVELREDLSGLKYFLRNLHRHKMLDQEKIDIGMEKVRFYNSSFNSVECIKILLKQPIINFDLLDLRDQDFTSKVDMLIANDPRMPLSYIDQCTIMKLAKEIEKFELPEAIIEIIPKNLPLDIVKQILIDLGIDEFSFTAFRTPYKYRIEDMIRKIKRNKKEKETQNRIARQRLR